MTQTVTLFIATSLDGMIASPDGGVDWQFTAGDYGFEPFLASVDRIVSGRVTYEQSLGFGPWSYGDRPFHVFSSSAEPLARPEGGPWRIEQEAEPVQQWLARFKHEHKDRDGHIWLLGGAQVAQACLAAGLVDAMELFVHPVVLGRGIALFTGSGRSDWRLAAHRAFDDGLLQLSYRLTLPPGPATA
jgi:dihydrofolate reductase